MQTRNYPQDASLLTLKKAAMFWQVIEMCTICIFGFLLLLSDSLFVEEKGAPYY